MRRGEDLTQEWLAKEVPASLSSVQKWETGGATPGAKNLQRIATVLETTVEALRGSLSGDGPEHVSVDQSILGGAFAGGVRHAIGRMRATLLSLEKEIGNARRDGGEGDAGTDAPDIQLDPEED